VCQNYEHRFKLLKVTEEKLDNTLFETHGINQVNIHVRSFSHVAASVLSQVCESCELETALIERAPEGVA